VDYDSSIHSSGFSMAVIGAVALGQLWLPLIALALVVSAAIVIRVGFRRKKRATDV
jgi:ABC-type uncharacterized transport system YnjBCD permease subunit